MPEDNKLEGEPPITSNFTAQAVGTGGTGSSTPPPEQCQQQNPQQNPISASVMEEQWFGNRG